ncbi:hypothetical protein AQUCO_03400137v1 [Aquilegia coerulea]|uniref:Protein kinase domain-containing protein n=1 Tax=Aquilegia coerulea TaxID=218851 RepID=A0A2G5CXN0_AQUCA|nr:hypothetical protein AQUCO_03400137v1 [Aquilegia coerulea]
MQLNHLCFILPADLDEIVVFDPHKTMATTAKDDHTKHHHQQQLLVAIRRLLHRFWNQKWITSCPHNPFDKRQSQIFQDIPGAVLSEKVCDNNPRIFSYTELYIGSNGFSEDEVLGSGGFGRVYKALLPSDGTVVAVKCVTEKGESFEKTFVAELMAVASLRHRNLVRLRGWCIHEEQLLLVYDYMPNRSLDHILFRRPGISGMTVLDWKRRVRIVSGLAAALFYLHEQLETQIIHRDVKTSNVMLDSNYNARLGDFGLARWLEHELQFSSPIATSSGKKHRFRLEETTRVGGTIGYLPPESFQRRGITTAKSDVFSFGVVALEVASGRRAVDLTYPDEEIILLDWVRWLSDKGNHLQAVDSRLPEGSYKLSDMRHLIHLGLLCSLNDPKMRPSMKWVVEALSGNFIGELPALPSFNSHPYYISLSSSTTSTTSTKTTATSKITSSTTASSTPSSYVTATSDSMFVTADNGHSNGTISNSRNRPITFHSVNTPQEMSYKELLTATNNFSEDRRVAELDFGTAYYGLLNNRHQVLVKRLGMKTCPALRARFSDELHNLKQLRHRNLVQLRGWCTEQGEMLVVCDYSACHLLSHLLFYHQERPVLQWHHRYNIIKSLASAIIYLHEDWDDQVIHRNITSAAIILEPDMNPRLGCFALAEFLARNEHGPHVIINPKKSVRGIFGYMSPEYMESGEATPATDIYSFGVVMLEIVTGRMAVDFQRPEVLLVKKVRQFETQKRPLVELVDWRLDGEYNHRELERMVSLGMACTRSDPDLRPTMRQIVSTLDGNDKWLKVAQRKEKREEWQRRNASSLSLIRRIQALGIQ